MPTALSFPRYADIARRLVLASRLPSRAAPALNPHSAAAEPVPNFPRLRALALFGRRPVERAGLSLLPASKNQHRSGKRPHASGNQNLHVEQATSAREEPLA